MQGHGSVSALGGLGDGTAGGGAGGRISLHSMYHNQFRGSLNAYGRGGTAGGDVGGPGSVFLQDMLVRNLDWEYRLYVDGQNTDPPKPLVINETNPLVHTYGVVHDNFASISFDHLLLKNKVRHLWKCNGSVYNCVRRFVERLQYSTVDHCTLAEASGNTTIPVLFLCWCICRQWSRLLMVTFLSTPLT